MTRREFSKATRAAILARSQGVCEVHLIPDEFRTVRHKALPKKCKRPSEEVDHIECAWSDGNVTEDNGAALCAVCHAIKTKIDKKEAAKSARLRGETGQYARRERAKEAGSYKPIPSRGFGKGWKRKFNGMVKRNNT
jgi:Zn finger protein HypA/HybF involved in hydrogenase expression